MSASGLSVPTTRLSLGLQFPSGLVDGVANTNSITLTGISPLLTETSVVQATIQVPDAAGGGLNVWLVSATPSSASGGTIVFTLADDCSSPTTDLVVAWAVIKF
jgi:hypothetical protein